MLIVFHPSIYIMSSYTSPEGAKDVESLDITLRNHRDDPFAAREGFSLTWKNLQITV